MKLLLAISSPADQADLFGIALDSSCNAQISIEQALQQLCDLRPRIARFQFCKLASLTVALQQPESMKCIDQLLPVDT